MNLAIKVAIILLVFIGDPFGLKSATKEESVEIITRLTAVDYPGSSANGDAAVAAAQPKVGQDLISVVLMTDKAAEQLAGGYPVPLRIHGEVISDIICAGAKAVFVDFNFRWEREAGDATEFVNFLRRRPDNGGDCPGRHVENLKAGAYAKVFMGHVPSGTSDCDPLGSESPVGCEKREGFVALRAIRDVATVLTLPEPKSDLRYVAGETQDGKAVTSPALALVSVLCTDKPGLPICRQLDRLKNETMMLRWAWLTSPRDADLKKWLRGSCGPDQDPTHPEFRRARVRLTVLREAIAPLATPLRGADIRGNAVTDGTFCFFHDTLAANDVVEAKWVENSAVFRTSTGGDVTGGDVLKTFFKDRVVFYGAHITAIGDYAKSPTLGRVPGVYAHAMALDNLVSLGGEHWRGAQPVVPKANFTWPTLFELCLSIALLLAGWLVDQRNDLTFKRRDVVQQPWPLYDKPVMLLVTGAGRIGRCLGRIGLRLKYDRSWIRLPPNMDRQDKAYWLHWGRKWLFVLTAAFVVGAAVLFEVKTGWPPNDWIALLAVIPLAKPTHRKFEEWTGEPHIFWRYAKSE